MTLQGLPLAEPNGGHAVAVAARWIEHALTGTVATTIATLAVAAVGFLMLRGRLPFRRGGSVIVGCFILFGASTIAKGVMQVPEALDSDGSSAPVAIAPAPLPSIAPPPAQPQVYDPYAGASVPVR